MTATASALLQRVQSSRAVTVTAALLQQWYQRGFNYSAACVRLPACQPQGSRDSDND